MIVVLLIFEFAYKFVRLIFQEDIQILLFFSIFRYQIFARQVLEFGLILVSTQEIVYSSINFWIDDALFFLTLKAPKILQIIESQIIRFNQTKIRTSKNINYNEFNLKQKQENKNIYSNKKVVIKQMTSLKYSQQSEDSSKQNFQSTNENNFTKYLLKQLQKYDDSEQLSLQQSIPILYELNIFQELTSIPDAKKRLTNQAKPNQRLQLEARFIYNLWRIIQQETVEMGFFKQIITLFITEQTSTLALKLENKFHNQNQAIIEILAIWEGMIQNKSFNHSLSNDFQDQSALIERQIQLNVSNQWNTKSKKNQIKNSHSVFNQPKKSYLTSNYDLTQKQNYRHSSSKHSNLKNQTDRNSNLTKRQNIQQIRNQIYNSQIYQIPVLSHQKQKELINRLYVVNKYDRYQQLKKIQDEQKILKQMEQCTFQPKIDKDKKKRCQTASKSKSLTQNKTIPGFQKAIQRMKTGQVKTKQLKQKLQLRNINLKATKDEGIKIFAPPKFLTRQQKKEQKKVLFTIQFDIGRHKLTCKIHQGQSADQLAKNIQSIYSLKEDSFEQIRQIIEQQIERYFQLNKQCDEKQDQEKVQKKQNENKFQLNQKGNNFIFC